MLNIIVAISENNAIGKDNDMPWHLPNDLKRFKKLTTGHTVIMGRKTYDSLPNGALPNRRNIIISSNTSLNLPNCETANSLDAALALADTNNDEAFIIGGASIYKQALPFAETLYITLIHHTFDNADTFFPQIDEKEWLLIENKDFPTDEKHAYSYSFQTYVKKTTF